MPARRKIPKPYTSSNDEPTADELVDALRVLVYFLDADTTRDGLRMIGLHVSATFPCMPRQVKSTDHARDVLRRFELHYGDDLAAARLAKSARHRGER